MVFFEKRDCGEFRDWLDLNWEGITWQGRFEKEFLFFWEMFFIEGIHIGQLMDRYEYARKHLKAGPLCSWMDWLKEKNLCYFFIYKDISLHSLAQEAKIPISFLANSIRQFLVEKFPHMEGALNEKFQVGNILSDHLYLTFEKISGEFNISRNFKGSFEDEIMTSLEVTLYPDWGKFLQKMRKDFLGPHLDIQAIIEKTTLRPYRKFLKEVLFLFIVGGTSIFTLERINQWYEGRLSKKIRLFEPDFLWTDKSLVFKSAPVNPQKIELELKELEKIKEAKFADEGFEREERFEEETDVILTSFETLPQDIQRADFEKSEYEEILKGGYRDEQLGSKKVYRIMMKSGNVDFSRQKIDNLLKTYGVTQANTVRPGMAVPGGIYYNLFVPRDFLLEFLSKVGQVEESSIFVSKTSKASAPGKTKVFIWIKEI